MTARRDENPLSQIPAFGGFQGKLPAWIAENPKAEPLTIVGSYRPSKRRQHSMSRSAAHQHDADRLRRSHVSGARGQIAYDPSLYGSGQPRIKVARLPSNWAFCADGNGTVMEQRGRNG